MDENNNIENNITPSVETNNEAPVEPVVPVEPAAPEAPAPVEAAPVEAAPVAEPVQEPVAPQVPSEPVMPTEPSATTQIPVQPQQPLQGVVEQPPKKKGLSIAFVIIVLILILAIIGLGIGLIVLAVTNSNIRNGGKTTSTTTVQVTEGTSTIPVTTQESTTTIPRTTRSIDTPTPTSVDEETVKVGSYDMPLPAGYKIYKNTASYPIVVSTTKKTQISLLYNAKISYSTIVANPDRAISDLQSHGCTVVDATSGVIGSHQWMLFLLDYPGTPDGYAYVYGITSLSTGVLETAMYIPKSGDLVATVKDVNYMLDNAKSGASSFAPSVSESEEFNTGIIDNIDSRIFE